MMRTPLPALKKKTGLADIGYQEDNSNNAQTFDFEDIRAKAEKKPTRYSYQDPYIPPSNRDQIEEERRRQAERDAKRRERQRSMGLKLNNPQTVNELENEPAFLRRGVNLDKVPNSDEPAMSKWTISDDDQPEIREGNSFLHDNVD